MNKKRIKHIVNTVIWSITGLYLSFIVLLHLPVVQGYIGSKVSDALGDKLGTVVSIGKVDLGLLNRIIIDDALIKDKNHKDLLTAGRISAKFDIIPLFNGRVSISSAQLFGVKINAYKKNAESDANFQFILDSLASKDNSKPSTLDLNINTLIIRHGALAYNQLNAPRKGEKLDFKHLNIDKISGHFILNKYSPDSLNASIKSLSFEEQSGLKIDKLRFAVIANTRKATLEDFLLQMPNSELNLGDCYATYEMEDKKIIPASLQYGVILSPSHITPSDLAFLYNPLIHFKKKVNLEGEFNGTSTSARAKNVHIKSSQTELALNGSLRNWEARPRWSAQIEKLRLSANDIKDIANNIGKNINIPKELTRIGNISFVGNIGGYGDDLATTGVLKTGVGNANLALGKHHDHISARLVTPGIELGKILDDSKLGMLTTSINVDGKLKNANDMDLRAVGKVSRFDYNGYSYRNININGDFDKDPSGLAFKGLLAIDDPNGKIALDGNFSMKNKLSIANIKAHINNVNPKAMKLYEKFPGNSISTDITANFKGSSLNQSEGNIHIGNLIITDKSGDYMLDDLTLNTGYQNGEHFMNMTSDFGEANLKGTFDYSTLAQSITNIVRSKLPTLPGLPAYKPSHNNFAINATLHKSDWLKKFLGVELETLQPITLSGIVNDNQKKIDITAKMPQFSYSGTNYERGFVRLSNPNDTLLANLHIRRLDDKGHGFYWNVQAAAADNNLHSAITWNNRSKNLFKGQLISDANFYKTDKGQSAANINIQPSELLVGDTIWHIQPGNISYFSNHLDVNNLAVEHNSQHLIINGTATKSKNDAITVDLNDMDVSYILNLINFHSVDFSGYATGSATVSSVFSDPQANANLRVKQFRFQGGRMGTLEAKVNYWNEEGQINIDAFTHDDGKKNTIIKGFVSPKHNTIDLNVDAMGTRLEFVESFCGSFMEDVEATAVGNVRVFGPLNKINLAGTVVANGPVTISSLNTSYELSNDTVRIIPDHIIFSNDTVYDRNSNVGILTGQIDHKNLKDFKFFLTVDAQNLLAYDTHDFGTNTFYGTAYATGKCTIDGTKSGEIIINVDATPEKGSVIVYNAADRTSLTSQEFIHWNTLPAKNDSISSTAIHVEKEEEKIDIPTDIRLNFLINTTPDATIRLLMDEQSGDYIALNGSGVLRATYYNKGSFDLYGNYLVDHGVYKLTIQNIIKKDFDFQQGGTISFGGDPFNASLNLKAIHTVAGVSLSDLNIGRSFSNNNIRVNCLMNITGTPGAPKVDFGLDMPTVNDEAKQMIFSLINSEEEMNQQVLYLLAIGRFYTTGRNNASIEGGAAQSQTSLAMQSLLSGTVSQQINTVLNSVIKNTNWNFGANISPGDEGWNNAEYEGLLSGRLLNNRLIFNGQFGYRDNPNATTSFIGDFDLQYLIVPNGNFAIRVYNQTNDRYFTRNSLNTQGIGLILKKDFLNFKDLFNFGKKKTEPKKTTKKQAVAPKEEEESPKKK